ncbi:M48 family metallopeptidase, partial [bacterium]|nr:M48 family metallopeptidase [bacterium]
MKKIILVTTLLFCSISPVFASHLDNQLEEIDNNVKYSTPKQHAEVYKYKDEYTLDIAKDVFDPKLIEFTKYTKIDEEKYKSKLAKDEQEYQKKIIPAIYKKTKTVNIEPEGVDFYNTYRIAEKIIRANNLDYINWRVAIRKTPVSNAAAFDGNYIVINTGLYDSVYESEEAFAFVIAHEMAHHILGHMQRVAELNKEINFLKAHVSSVKKSSPKNSGIAELSANTQLMGIYKEFRKMEYMADAEALILITKAGYSPYKGIETLNYLNTFNNVTTLDSAHPSPKKRIEAYNENISVLDPNWKYVGIENIYKSDVLKCKKSSDRVSIVISKSKTDKNF